MQQRWAAPAVTTALLTVAVAAVAVRDPHRPGSWGYCPVLVLTGQPCPGCGGLRAVHDLAHGQVGAAVGSNLLAVLGLVGLVVLLGRWAWRRRARPDVPLVQVSARTAVAAAAVVLGFGLLRLLPAFAWFRP